MTDTTEPPEGWYPDPDNHARLRWWDGGQWTGHERENPAVQAPAQPTPAQAIAPDPSLDPVVVPVAEASPYLGDSDRALEPGGGPPVATIAPIVLAAWAALALVNSFGDFMTTRIEAQGLGSLFQGLHHRSAGLLGGFDRWWFDSPLGAELNIFQLALLVVAILATVGVATKKSTLVRAAGVAATVHIVVFAIVWIPIRDGVGWADFVVAIIAGSLLPVGATVGIFRTAGASTTPADMPSRRDPVVHHPVGVRQGAPDHYAAMPYGGPRRTNSFAIAALVLGILGVSLIAVVFGHLALSQINQSQGRETGRGLAIAGLVLGYLWMLAALIFIVAVFVIVNEANSGFSLAGAATGGLSL